MMARTELPLVVALMLGGALRSEAQARDTARTRGDSGVSALSCPRDGGRARAWLGGIDLPSDSLMAGPRPPAGVVDTIITLDITDRRWQRDHLSAGVSLGAAGAAGARGAPWHACAGATATLGRVTATLHNVRGRIHLRADAGALRAIGRKAVITPPVSPRR